MIKLISKISPIKLLFDLLFWKITKYHNLRESHSNFCEICNCFFKLRDKTITTVSKYKLHSKPYTKFSKKYQHLGYTQLGVFDSWKPVIKETIIKLEKYIWPRWLPLFVKRWIHYWATENSVVRVKNRFWYNIENKLTKGFSIFDIKDKWGGL
jgi:hypothetical protein